MNWLALMNIPQAPRDIEWRVPEPLPNGGLHQRSTPLGAAISWGASVDEQIEMVIESESRITAPVAAIRPEAPHVAAKKERR
jgi:hypothetical protein